MIVVWDIFVSLGLTGGTQDLCCVMQDLFFSLPSFSRLHRHSEGKPVGSGVWYMDLAALWQVGSWIPKESKLCVAGHTGMSSLGDFALKQQNLSREWLDQEPDPILFH